jgi:hypothetical protein
MSRLCKPTQTAGEGLELGSRGVGVGVGGEIGLRPLAPAASVTNCI